MFLSLKILYELRETPPEDSGSVQLIAIEVSLYESIVNARGSEGIDPARKL